MMLQSMTGFGRGEKRGELGVVVEIKSLNHRYCDIRVKLPQLFSRIEIRMIDYLKGRLIRGSIEVSLFVEGRGSSLFAKLRPNLIIAREWKDALSEVAKEAGLSPKVIALDHILNCPNLIEEVMVEGVEEEKMWEMIQPALDEALSYLQKMRQAEGKKIEEDLRQRLTRVEKAVAQIEEFHPKQKEVVFASFRKRLEELFRQVGEVGRASLEERLLQESALFADRMDITEEILRLQSHTAQFQNILSGEEAVGKRLDFLLQEMHREVSTIGAKACSAEISGRVVEIKSLCEQMREQLQNLV